MKIESKKLERGQVELTIELTVDEYQPFLKTAAQIISQTTKIPGWRPGKASFEIVKQRVGETKIWQEALELAVRKTLIQAIDQEKLITIGSPKVDIIKLAPGNPVIYKTTLSLIPSIKLADYSKIKVKTNPVTVKEKEIKKSLDNLGKSRAKQILVNRKSKEGDKIEIDFESSLDKIPIENGNQKKFPLVIGEKTFIPGFEEQLIGLKKDQTKEFQLKFPENYHQKNLAGKLVDFKIKVLAVYQMELPELNDEFAKSLGEFKSLEELKNRITNDLEARTKTKENQRVEEEIIDKIIEQSQFEDIPDLLINNETQKMIEELEHNLGHQGLKFDDYLNHLKKKREDLLLDFMPQAIKRVKSALALREITKKENIAVNDQEIEEEIKQTLQVYGNDPEVEKQLRTTDYKNYLQNILTGRKTLDHLKSIMTR